MSDIIQTKAAEGATTEPRVIGDDVLIILPVRNSVLFPQVVLPIAIKRERSVAAAQEAVKAGRKVGLLLQRDPEQDDPGAEGLYPVGTMATIVRYVTAADGTHHLICQGEQRFSVLDFVSRDPFLVARITPHPEPTQTNPEIEARALRLRELAIEALRLLPQAPAELVNAIQAIESIPAIVDLIASFLDLKPTEKQEVLVDLRPARAARSGVESPAPARRGAAHLARNRRARQGGVRRTAEGGGAARAAAPDSQGARRRRGRFRRGGRAEGTAGEGRHAGRSRRARAQPDCAAGAHGRGERRIFDDPHLSRVAAGVAVVEARQGGNRHRKGAAHPR